jgi:hypothetical protein
MEGWKDGRKEGRKEGWKDGRMEGRKEGRKERGGQVKIEGGGGGKRLLRGERQ